MMSKSVYADKEAGVEDCERENKKPLLPS